VNHHLVVSLKSVGFACAAAFLLSATPAEAQVQIRLFPPPEFRATERPVYYRGHATYWYHGRWRYQEGREWREYRDEPFELHDRRDRRSHHYERR
jgi:hypothetical protein